MNQSKYKKIFKANYFNVTGRDNIKLKSKNRPNTLRNRNESKSLCSNKPNISASNLTSSNFIK